MKKRVGVIILAAGESSRFGKPKQLVVFEGKTLIQRAVYAAVACASGPVVVVLGSSFHDIAAQIEGAVKIVENREWAAGMGGSIRCGLAAIDSDVDAVLITLCDQPLVSSAILNRFVEAGDSDLVAAAYGGSIGVPALFGRDFFPDLYALDSHHGAKQVLMKNESQVFQIPCPEAAIDIDTAEDYQRLVARKTLNDQS